MGAGKEEKISIQFKLFDSIQRHSSPFHHVRTKHKGHQTFWEATSYSREEVVWFFLKLQRRVVTQFGSDAISTLFRLWYGPGFLSKSSSRHPSSSFTVSPCK